MTTKSSWPRLKPPADGRLSNTPTTSKRSLPTRTSLPIGSVPLGSNSSLIGGVAEHGDVPPVLQLGAVEEPAGEHRDARAVGEVLGGAEHDQRLGLAGRGRTRAAASAARPAPSSMSTSWIVVGSAPRARARRRRVRFGRFSSSRDLGAVGEAGDAEPLDEDGVRPDRARSCRAATGRSRGSSPSCRRSR